MPSWNPSETVREVCLFPARFEFIKSGMTSTDQKLKSQLIFSFIDQECFIVVVISISFFLSERSVIKSFMIENFNQN